MTKSQDRRRAEDEAQERMDDDGGPGRHRLAVALRHSLSRLAPVDEVTSLAMAWSELESVNVVRGTD